MHNKWIGARLLWALGLYAGTIVLPGCGGTSRPSAAPSDNRPPSRTAGATGGGTVPIGLSGTGGVGATVLPPARCHTTYEAETMQASTGEAVAGGWNLYTQGTLTTMHPFTGGPTNLTVTARGSVAAGVWPHMVVRAGSQTVGEVDVNSLSWAPYLLSGNVAAGAGAAALQIEFTNDGSNGTEDRNLYVDKVEVDELCSAPSAGNGGAPGTPSLDPINPFATPLYLEGGSLAAGAVGALKGSGSSTDADLLEKIASAPQATWIGGWSGDPAGAVSGALDQAGGSLRVLVAYNIYNRDCGNQSAGGVADAPSYKSWIDGFANGIGERKVAVILEPDTLAHDCDPTRWDVLSYAVSSLKKKTNAHVYIDAGHAGWVDAGTMAARLKTAGIATADGFALNVAAFETTDASVAYGTAISGSVGGKPFVIDTGRNGKGSAGSEWCNPPGRGLGERPTGNTSRPLVQAFLWVKRPGESDGTCNGGPPAGQWFQSYALDLARNAVF